MPAAPLRQHACCACERVYSRAQHPNRYNYQTGEISDDVAEQAQQILVNVDAALREAGASMADVVRVRYILPDRREFPKTWPVLKKWFGEVCPAATMVESGLMKEEMKIEIEVTAKKGCGAKKQ